ncbi:Chlorophyll synthesis pathway, bchC [uncultured delta proteobacterium]|uniref:Chlorophyll synthesis pathway, bchC n=1 Tax=uncultured delta proteobacterium TaxID=34034 RepID=A0A212JIS2_9DELT|nr:Chlorophyll synthesis pathway, bchC [uncultured delta proteobacterium]
MKAVVKQVPEHGAVHVVSVSQPSPPAGDEVLVRIHSAALCGSDLHAFEYIPSYHSFLKIPVVLGHEGSGTVAAVGPEVTAFAPGDRVMSEAHLYCGTCPICRRGNTTLCENKLVLGITTDGVMREYALIREKYLHAVPDGLSFAEAAAAQAVSVSVHGVLGRVTIKPGDVALVSGPGIIGLAAAQLARQCGAAVTITGTDADEAIRMPVARAMDFDAVNCERENVIDYCMARYGRKADIVLECSGSSSALVSAVDAVRQGGTILLLGVPQRDVTFPLARMIRAEVNLISSYGSSWEDYEKTLALLANGSLSIMPLLAPYPVKDAEKAFHDGIEKTVVKPVLQFVPDAG